MANGSVNTPSSSSAALTTLLNQKLSTSGGTISGNLNVNGTLTASKISGLGNAAYCTIATGNYSKDTWGTIPFIGSSDGVMEVGKYLDFHTTDGNTADYDARITASTSGLTLSGTTTGTFKGNLTGNASTATKLATARTIGISGDVVGSASFDGSSNSTASVVRRGCIVGQTTNTATSLAKPYYKVASVSISGANTDAGITFYVHRAWMNGSANDDGILHIKARTGSNKTISSCTIIWLVAGSAISVDNYMLAYNASGTPVVVELWTKISNSYDIWAFDVIAENSRTSRLNNLWTLYNTISAGSQSAVTSGYTQITSSLATLKNSISGNAATATTATKLAKTVYINGIAFNGASNITIPVDSDAGSWETFYYSGTGSAQSFSFDGKPRFIVLYCRNDDDNSKSAYYNPVIVPYGCPDVPAYYTEGFGGKWYRQDITWGSSNTVTLASGGGYTTSGILFAVAAWTV